MYYLVGILLGSFLLGSTPAGAASAGRVASCEPLSFDFAGKAASWGHVPLSKLKRNTVYTLEQENGRAVLKAAADDSASLYAAPVKQAAGLPPILSWRWKADALVPGADNRDKKREDAPLRVILAFDGDQSALPEAERQRFKRAKKLFGRELPYAVLMYIWSEQVPVGTVIPSAHTGQVKMLVAASGSAGVGGWLSVRRTIAEDYRRAYNAEPGPVLGVAVMTDTDNTGTRVVGRYADIRFECVND